MEGWAEGREAGKGGGVFVLVGAEGLNIYLGGC